MDDVLAYEKDARRVVAVTPWEESETPEPTFRPEVLNELIRAGWFDNPVPDFTEGACVDYPDPDVFFHGRKGMAEAMALCESCPIRKECLSWAKSSGQKYGIWGGEFMGREPYKPVQKCHKGHKDWAYRSNGKRYCRACDRSYRERGKAAS